jgi:hypothetical protein
MTDTKTTPWKPHCEQEKDRRVHSGEEKAYVLVALLHADVRASETRNLLTGPPKSLQTLYHLGKVFGFEKINGLEPKTA